jgi:hypothetical protein
VVKAIGRVISAVASDCAVTGVKIRDLDAKKLEDFGSRLETVVTLEPQFSITHVWLSSVYEALARLADASRELMTASKLIATIDRPESERLGGRAQAIILPKEERERIVSKVVSESNRRFPRNVDKARGSFGLVDLGPALLSNLLLATGEQSHEQAIKSVAKKLGYTQKLVRAVCALHQEEGE